MMAIIFSTIKILSGIAIFQSVLIAFYLFTQKRGNKYRRYILGFLLLNFAIFVSGTLILLYFGKSANGQHLGHILNLSVFLTAPLLNFYFNSYSSKSLLIEKKVWLHFLPFAIIFSIMFYKMVMLKSSNFVFEPYGIFLISFLSIQNIAYLYLILSRYNKSYKGENDIGKRLNWFDFILKSFIILFTTKLIIFIVWNIFEQDLVCVFFTNIFFVLSFLIVNTLVLFGLYKPELLIGSVKYQSNPIDQKLKKSYLKSLDDELKLEEMFLDPLISLEKVAKKIRIPSKHLSQILNETYNINFNEYINRFRIEKAMKLLTENPKKNILEIAYEVGFNSKTTFNTAFKKYSGKTPSEFRI